MYMFSSRFYNNHVKQITKFSQIHNQPIKWDEKQITASSPVLIAHDLASTKDQKISSKTEIYPLNGNRGMCFFGTDQWWGERMFNDRALELFPDF